MGCIKQKFTGRDVVLEYSIGCGDQLPLEVDWKRFGSLRTKEFEINWDSQDATDSDSVGALRESLATFQTLKMSGDGTVKASGAGSANLIELTKHVARPEATGGDPVAWMRMTFPDLTFIAYMLMTKIARSAPYDNVVTYSMEATATASDFGLIVEDTPDPDAPDPTGIQVVPNALSLTVGETFNCEAVVLPVGAPQSLRWTSNAPNVLAVNQISGEVTALSPGVAVITAASSVLPGVTSTAEITVIPLVQGITVAPSMVFVAVAETQQLTAAVSPAGATPGLVYESDNPAVATVDAAGLVEGVKAGSATVTITSAARPAVKVSVPVTVE